MSKKTNYILTSKTTMKLQTGGWKQRYPVRDEIPGYPDIEAKVNKQTTRGTRMVECLNETIWRNKNVKIEPKLGIYKAMVRPIMTSTAT